MGVMSDVSKFPSYMLKEEEEERAKKYRLLASVHQKVHVIQYAWDKALHAG
jgi:hypothetical protein